MNDDLIGFPACVSCDRRRGEEHNPDCKYADNVIARWKPNYLPSNGTAGMGFREDWCNRCQADINEDCQIFTDSLLCYPDPGPDEWEMGFNAASAWMETRCTAFAPKTQGDET